MCMWDIKLAHLLSQNYGYFPVA